jgi:hypothetical protein
VGSPKQRDQCIGRAPLAVVGSDSPTLRTGVDCCRRLPKRTSVFKHREPYFGKERRKATSARNTTASKEAAADPRRRWSFLEHL